MHNTDKYKLIIKLIKVFPIIGAFLLWIRVLLLVMFEYQSPIIEMFVETSIIGGTLLILSSIVLEFCLLHKLFIYYNVLIGFCIDFQDIIGWGICRTPMRYVVLLLGIILFICLLFKYAESN